MSEPPPKKNVRISSQITMSATAQIYSQSASNSPCCRSSPCSARPISVNKPLAKRVVTHSRGATKIPCSTFCCSTGEETWGTNHQVQDKAMFGQHPARNRDVVSGIGKVTDMDPGQQKH